MASDQALVQYAESSLAPPVDLEIGLQVVERVAVGRSLEEIGAIPGFPNKETFLIWLIQSPALAQAFAKAREVSGYALEEEALSLLRRLNGTQLTAQQKAKVTEMLVAQLRWSAEKRNPTMFSKQNNVSVQIPVQINTNLDLGEVRSGVGTAEFPNIYEIKAVAPLEAEAGVMGKRRKARVQKDDTPERVATRQAARAARVREWRAKKKFKAEGLAQAPGPEGAPDGGSDTQD